MEQLPITHITLYKHGVGFFERRANLSGEEVGLSFRVEEMNDILKSLTVIDWGDGQVLGVDYATPQSREERLAGCSVRLDDDRSLQDLLRSLRGRRVRLLLDQQEQVSGTLLGLDDMPERQPLATALVSLLRDDSAQVQALPLGRLQNVEILDERGASDLRFFLHTALSQENYRQVTIRLSPGAHDLSVSYIAPAPTWRVSYRLVVDSKNNQQQPQALLLGWGIFDNRLEEDLQSISLALVAGMPISFVYDLYTPFTPERPMVKEETRVAAGPVEFLGAIPEAAPELAMAMDKELLDFAAPPPAPSVMPSAKRRAVSMTDMERSAPVTTKGEAFGELFQYVIGTPVTVGRGQSAMVPILSSRLASRKDLLYNGAKMPAHPVATLRLQNATGLTLERGPVTVIENSEYVGEAVLPFTVVDGELVVPYAVELGVKVTESSGSERKIHGLRITGAYLLIEEWDQRWREYRLHNNTGQAITVLVEHPRSSAYELIETPDPTERTDEHFRFAVTVPARKEITLSVKEHRLVSRREELQRQSAAGIRKYLEQRLLDRKTHDYIAELLTLWGKLAEKENALTTLEHDRQKIYKAQQQIQGNLQALGTQGKEGTLRARYVDQLESSEEQLKTLTQQENALKAEIKQIQATIDQRLRDE